MRRTFALSLIAPLALAMAACAAGGESASEDEEIEIDAGLGDTDGGGESDGGGGGAKADGGGSDASDGGDDDDADAAADADPDGEEPGDGDAGDGGGEPLDGSDGDADADGDGGAGGGDAGESDADPAGPDAAPDPCEATECYIGASCVEAGTPKTGDACQVCLPTVNRAAWSHDATSPACDGKPYWDGVTRALPVTPYGRKTAVSCHNCYVLGSSNADSLGKTLAKVNAAQVDGADLIELDIKEQSGVVYVEHDDSGGTRGALLSDVLANPGLKSGNQLLFIESKETTASEAYVRKVLEALQANGYAKAGRPVVLRAFDGVSANLVIARKLLATPEFISMRPHVRLQVLFSQGDGSNIANLQARVKGAKDKGYHGVEFEYRTTNLFGALKYAESLDLGINVWTIPISVGEVFLATLRDEVDAITVDYPVDKSRQVVEHKNGLAYLNTWNQPAAAGSVKWFQQTHAVWTTLPLGASDRPTLIDSTVGQSLFGGVLTFNAAASQHAPLYDADNDANDGYLVSAVVAFDNPIPADGQTSVIVGKADAAGFSLELFNPSGGGNTDAVLRFGVYVKDQYWYATYPANQLQAGPSYQLTGAYDGNGGVWLWIDNSDANVTKASPPKMGVARNDSPIVVGADPQGATATRFYFAGKVQMALVQRWADH